MSTKNHPLVHASFPQEAIKSHPGLGGSYKQVSPNKDNSLTMIRNKLEQLRKVQAAREANKQHAVAGNDKIKDYSAMIEEKETEIMKLMSIVDMLQNSREQHIKEAGEAFDKEHPFTEQEAEITMLRDAEEALAGRSAKRGIEDYIGQITKSHIGGIDPYHFPSPYHLKQQDYNDDIIINGGLDDAMLDLEKTIKINQKDLPF